MINSVENNDPNIKYFPSNKTLEINQTPPIQENKTFELTFRIPILNQQPEVYIFTQTFNYTCVYSNDLPIIDLTPQPPHDPVFFVNENLEILIDVSDPERDTIIGFPTIPFNTGSLTLLQNGTFMLFENNLQLNRVKEYNNYVI